MRTSGLTGRSGTQHPTDSYRTCFSVRVPRKGPLKLESYNAEWGPSSLPVAVAFLRVLNRPRSFSSQDLCSSSSFFSGMFLFQVFLGLSLASPGSPLRYGWPGKPCLTPWSPPSLVLLCRPTSQSSFAAWSQSPLPAWDFGVQQRVPHRGLGGAKGLLNEVSSINK